jgi:hypothetical protein
MQQIIELLAVLLGHDALPHLCTQPGAEGSVMSQLLWHPTPVMTQHLMHNGLACGRFEPAGTGYVGLSVYCQPRS